MSLRVIYFGDKRLRERCKEITEITAETKAFAKQLIDTMNDYSGCGLAAPQVGELQRIFIIAYIGDDEDGWPIVGEPTVCINPTVEVIGDEVWTTDEGCLSVPGITVPVERPWKIKATYLTLDGNEVEEVMEGWRARNFLHENDHLNGVLHVDRTETQEKRKVEPKLRLLKKKYG